MPTLLQISQLGNPVLRKKAIRVKNIKGADIQSLIDNMIETCKDSGGVGIAAPQVNQSLRLFIMALNPSPRFPNAPDMELTAIINPEIISFSSEWEMGWEGCLSVPGIRGSVTRCKSVTVRYTNRQNQHEERTFEGFLARIFQHEHDHLDGIVFLDQTDSKNLVTLAEYQRIIQEAPKN